MDEAIWTNQFVWLGNYSNLTNLMSVNGQLFEQRSKLIII